MVVFRLIPRKRIYLNGKFLTHVINSLFKNEVENATIKLRASDERNWPSFLYPEGTVYNELELDKGLFRGHVFLRVHLSFSQSHLTFISQFTRFYELSLRENHLPLMASDLLPSPLRRRCMECGRSSQKQSHMRRSR
jgi:hypothetical protein